MLDNNLTFITTPARTGSTLIYNYVRLMFVKNEFTVLPKILPQTREKWYEYATKAQTDFNDNIHYLIKNHTLLRNDLKRSRFIVITRDPIEIFNSYSRFMKCEPDQAIDNLMHATKLLCHYRDNFSAGNRLFINYKNIINNPTHVIQKMALFLNLKISHEQAKEVRDTFTKEKVSSDIELHHQEVVKTLTDGNNVDRAKIVRISKSNWRVFDSNTGFQSGHINVGENCDFYSELDRSRQKLVDRICVFWNEQKLQQLGELHYERQ